jgi:hypothetical protein
VSPFTFVGNRIDTFVVCFAGRRALDAVKRRYDRTAAHRDTDCPLPSHAIASQPGGSHAEQPL